MLQLPLSMLYAAGASKYAFCALLCKGDCVSSLGCQLPLYVTSSMPRMHYASFSVTVSALSADLSTHKLMLLRRQQG
jgi:hypothetical protein